MNSTIINIIKHQAFFVAALLISCAMVTFLVSGNVTGWFAVAVIGLFFAGPALIAAAVYTEHVARKRVTSLKEKV
jgi:hypothetical protein